MGNKIFIGLILLSFLTLNRGMAQDTHFSQFYASPLSLNPAMSGDFKGAWRVTNNVRLQKSATSGNFQTLSLGFDLPFTLGGNKFGAGIYILSDKTPVSTSVSNLATTKYYLSFSYEKEVNGNKFRFGLQPGYVSKNLSGKPSSPSSGDFNNVTSGKGQFLSGAGADLGESLGTSSKSTLIDLNFGVTWSKKMGKFTPVAGISFFHLNSPSDKFFTQSGSLKMKKVIYGGGRYELNSKFYVRPNIIFQYSAGAREVNLGGNIGHYVAKNKYGITSIFAGPMYRSNAATGTNDIILVAGAFVKNFEVGVSYDYHTGGIQSLSGLQQSLEFSLIYIAPSTLLKKYTVPCDRL